MIHFDICSFKKLFKSIRFRTAENAPAQTGQCGLGVVEEGFMRPIDRVFEVVFTIGAEVGSEGVVRRGLGFFLVTEDGTS